MDIPLDFFFGLGVIQLNIVKVVIGNHPVIDEPGVQQTDMVLIDRFKL